MSILWVRKKVDSGGAVIDLAAGPGNVKYKKQLQILTDSYDDGSKTISEHPDFPQPYEVYRDGTDYDEQAVATKVGGFRRAKKQPLLWYATVTYTVIPGVDSTGGGGVDITNYTPDVRTWKIPYEEVVWMARRQLVGTTWASPTESYADAMARSRELVRNSVNEMYASGIGTLKHALAVEVRRYEWYYNMTAADAYEDTVNAATFWGFAPGTVKMVAIQGNLTNVQNSLVYSVAYEFHINKAGWAVPIPDSGYHRHSTATGAVPGTWGAVTGVAAVLDERGSPRGSPSLLDGGGYAAAGVTDKLAHGATPYLVKWHHLEESTFATLALPTKASLNIT